MKTYKFTQLFLYCSGGERSVKCVHPGCTSPQDDTCPGQAHRAIMLDVIVQIDDVIREN